MIVNQIFKFIGISGIGWLIDFSIFTFFTNFLNFKIFYANIISSIPAISLVFFISTRKIFKEKKSNNLIKKYILYIIYQFILLLVISYLGEYLYGFFKVYKYSNFKFIKILIKIFITPITMTLNFIFMKILVERI